MPQRFVDIQYRGSAPEWSGVPQCGSLEAPRVEAGSRSPATPTLRHWSPDHGARRPVTSFTYQPPTLSELFRQAVAA